MNSSGKVLIIFLVITAILLISLTAIALFFFQKETERRKLAEATLQEYQTEKDSLEANLEEIKKQNFLLQEKNKEADDRVNDLSDELELEKGLREEMKLEAVSLAEELEALKIEKKAFAEVIEVAEEAKESLISNLSESQRKIKELEAQLKAEVERSQKLGELFKQQEEQVIKLEESRMQQEKLLQEKKIVESQAVTINELPDNIAQLGIELEEIVIDSETSTETLIDESNSDMESQQGRILSVDIETGFVIVSLGTRDGLTLGNVLSVYRNEDYVGDIKITRLQSEMSAADLIQPLSVGKVRKNDQVKVK